MGLDTTSGRRSEPRPVEEHHATHTAYACPGHPVRLGTAFRPADRTRINPLTAQPTIKTQLTIAAQDQQDRIANGVQSGQLTAGETKNLEGREANLNREIKDDRQADGGKLTTQERQQVNKQQNNLSKSIYQDKHNANTAHYGNNEVGQRRENQQDRIAQGIRSGQMTAGEAARTENREQGINQQIHADRQANGGRLTGGGKEADQQGTEWRQPPDLSPEAQQQGCTQITKALPPGADNGCPILATLLFLSQGWETTDIVEPVMLNA